MRGRGIFIGVELVRLCASSRKCDSIIEGGSGAGWGEVRWWGCWWVGVGGGAVSSKRPAQPEDTLGGKRRPG